MYTNKVIQIYSVEFNDTVGVLQCKLLSMVLETIGGHILHLRLTFINNV